MNTQATLPALSADVLVAISGGTNDRTTPDLDGPLAPNTSVEGWPLNGGAPRINLPPSPYEQWGVQL